MVGLVALPLFGLALAGGMTPVLKPLQQQDPTLLSLWGPDGSSWKSVFTIPGFLAIGPGFLGSPRIFVRFLSLRSAHEVRPGAIVAVVWTLLATTAAVLVGMVGRAVLMTLGDLLADRLGSGGERVLPQLVAETVPDWATGLYIAIVLAPIMSTVDSLLVLASSAFVRDDYQKVKHPAMSDRQLPGRSRIVTFVLATWTLLIAFSVAALVPDRTVFGFAIFGWSGISATFCPSMILSLFWTKLTARGALCGMLAGFASVPFFKLVAPHLPWVGSSFAALSKLPPAFVISGIVAIAVSLFDKKGHDAIAGAGDELTEASRKIQHRTRPSSGASSP